MNEYLYIGSLIYVVGGAVVMGFEAAEHPDEKDGNLGYALIWPVLVAALVVGGLLYAPYKLGWWLSPARRRRKRSARLVEEAERRERIEFEYALHEQTPLNKTDPSNV